MIDAAKGAVQTVESNQYAPTKVGSFLFVGYCMTDNINEKSRASLVSRRQLLMLTLHFLGGSSTPIPRLSLLAVPMKVFLPIDRLYFNPC